MSKEASGTDFTGPLQAAPGGSATTHPAAVKHSVVPEEIAEALRQAGYRASVLERESGPQVHSAAHGLSFVVGFGRPASQSLRQFVDLSFYCPLSLRGELAAAVIDAWNRTKRFGRLFRQDQALVLSMDVLLAGGITEANLRAHCELWDHLLRDLLLHLTQPGKQERQAN